VKFIYQELPDDCALISAQLQGNVVVCSVELTEAKFPWGRDLRKFGRLGTDRPSHHPKPHGLFHSLLAAARSIVPAPIRNS
jgi:hypothetical protein